jgi:hypothetical protein
MAVIRGVGRSGAAWSYSGGNWRIEGIERVTANINKELKKIKGRSAAGLISAANHVLTDADKTPPKVPEDKGQLRNSRFVDPKRRKGGDPYVDLGYQTNYAAAVHEMLQSPLGYPINWNRLGSGPRFLQASLDRNRLIILETIRKHAQIK